MTKGRAALTRTPFRHKRRREEKVGVREDGLWRIAGKLWPHQWKPETPTPGQPPSWREYITDRAQQHGWRVCHLEPGPGEGGWPDLALFKGDQALFIELKVRDRYGKANRLQPNQVELLGLMAQSVRVEVWTWPDDDAKSERILGGEPDDD